MPSSALKRVERTIAELRSKEGFSREAADALQDLVDAVRAVEMLLIAVEGRATNTPVRVKIR